MMSMRTQASDRPTVAKLRYSAAGAALHELLAELARAEASRAVRGRGGWRALLRAVGEGPGRTVAEIARSEGQTRQGIQRVAHDLRRAGLVAFQPNPRHRRAPCLSLTERGEEQLAALRAADAAWSNALARGLDAGALRAAARTLRLLRARLAQDSQEQPDTPAPEAVSGAWRRSASGGTRRDPGQPRTRATGSGPPAFASGA
jgi:DNA-binding MarR family transcriptional regulator